MKARTEQTYGAFLRGNAKDGFQIGYVESPQYYGPVAEVYIDETWVWISTDEYEGTVMLNIQVLPKLQEALRLLAKQVKALK